MKTRLGLEIVVSAVIWALVILASSEVMGDTPGYSRLLLVLGGGAAATIILLGGLAARENKAK